jgi:poly(3-hydroxybutyrate) depolymerase
MLHGYTATPEGEESVSGWTAFLANTDVAVVYPEGSPTPEGGYGWATGAEHDSTTGTDDVAVVDEVVDVLISSDCVTPEQILLAGESNGAALGLLVACNPVVGARFAAFALAIPAVDQNVLDRCEGTRPFRLVEFASQLDQTVPYDGSTSTRPSPFLPPQLWFTDVAASIDRCSGLRTGTVPDAQEFYFRQCAVPAVFFGIFDGGHTWPGGPTGAGGLDPGQFPASAVAWCASGLRATPQPVSCPGVLQTYFITGGP